MRKRQWAATLMALGLVASNGTAVHGQAPAPGPVVGVPAALPYPQLPALPTGPVPETHVIAPAMPDSWVSRPGAVPQITPGATGVSPASPPRPKAIAEMAQPANVFFQESTSSAPTPTSSATGGSTPKTPGTQPTEFEKLIDERIKAKLAEIEAAKKEEAEKKAAAGLVVGDDLKLNVTWDWGGLRFKSADEAFNVHFGGRLMYDGVWWSESPQLRKPNVLAPGSPLAGRTGVGAGIGDLQDGFFVRRARVVGDGTIYQTIEFKVEFDVENYNLITFDEMYVGIKDLPYVDAVRIGQMHVPFGLEAYTSSRWQPMMERSPVFDAFYQEFAPGIFVNETFLDQRLTAQQMFHRVDYFNQFNGDSFGDGKYAFTARASGLPIYEDEGRYLLHLGLSYQLRSGSTPADFNNTTVLATLPALKVTTLSDLVRFRARPSLRDGVGLQGDTNRVVDTGNIITDHVQAVNAEFLAYAGPFWAQAEYCRTEVDNAVFPASNKGQQRGDLALHGAYAMVGYFLTGENRGYDMRLGKYDRVKPLEPFFLVRDENGDLACGLGAWELMYRFGYVDLNDGALVGGRYGEHTVGLTWYWNSNIRINFNYINGQRTLPPGASSGNVQGFGMRAALEF